MKPDNLHVHPKSLTILQKYDFTACIYDILDFPWELQYRKWRPDLVGDTSGEVLEAGVGTGRNLKYYQPDVNLTALELSPAMLKRAESRARHARCSITFVQDDVATMSSIPSGRYDWLIATFLCCVIPDELQAPALEQFARVLKPGGRFRLVEMVYSGIARLRKRQDFFAPFVERIYGARFDRNTLRHLNETGALRITAARFLKHDVYLLIEGIRPREKQRGPALTQVLS
jgi:ubiquinone/menaquinone biosynthesis C-methylase UbiE